MKNAPKELSHAACDYFFVVLCIFLTSLMGGSPAAAAERGQAFAMINEARTIARTGNYPEALNKLQEAISLADQNDEKLVMAVAYNNQAEIYRLQGDKVEALESYAQALQIYHEIGHRKGIASTAQKIDTILGRPSRSEPLEPVVTAQSPAMVEEPQEPQVLQPAAPEPSPETPQPEEVTLLTPETLETSPTTALEQPPTEVAPSPTREQLIEEALARVR
ncbi:MAG: tetratricopeptide repeat protein, partial [Deltaproteobacteria bacterium]|nr:tetratricopeptide repeat protein [Deltaproteobacteria bacterium]